MARCTSRLALALIFFGWSIPTASASPFVPAHGIRYVEQPTAITRESYQSVFPGLREWLDRIDAGDPARVADDLRARASAGSAREGELNLLAQLLRERGEIDEAVRYARAAVAAGPRRHLDHFQFAMACFAKLRQSRGPLQRWHWHSETLHAYEKAFALDPEPIPYRYYIAYSRLQTPRFSGGNPKEGLKLAQDGVARGQEEFLVVRADALRLTGRIDEAWSDYDASVEKRIFKLNSFVAAFRAALEKGDGARAQRYADYLVLCRPDSPLAHEALGDDFARRGDRLAARQCYRRAMEADSSYAPARDKWSKRGAVGVDSASAGASRN